MASDLEFVEFAVDQLKGAGDITYRKMFGEDALYCKGKVVALICDNQFFVKTTEAGRAFIGDVVEAPPYPGAKPSFLIGEQIEDKDWISNLVLLTEKELPQPKPKKKRKKKSRRET
jgi:TfoX/Sxy family transcriptional regulator of competence genes